MILTVLLINIALQTKHEQQGDDRMTVTEKSGLKELTELTS